MLGIIAMRCVGFGVVLLVIGLVTLAIPMWRRMRRSGRSHGTVFCFDGRMPAGGEPSHGGEVIPVVEFVDRDGTHRWGSAPVGEGDLYQVGDEVDVAYDPRNPEGSVRILSGDEEHVDIWIVSELGFVFNLGMILIMAGLVAILFVMSRG